ncbi:MAG: exodeoxyribonuclease V subunit gamma [Pseudomonadota bacterium]
MLHLHLSNRPDALAMSLAAHMRAAPLPLLDVEPVVAPSTAAARWLEFRLADALGIATRIAFVFPAAYVWQLFGRVLPDVAPTSPFDRAAMQWRLLRLLGDSGAPEVRRYLAADDGRKRCELANRLAGLFERYLVERPDWIAAWNAGKRCGLGPDEGWQAGLWRMLMEELAPMAAEHPRERFLAALRRDPAARARLPARIALFAVETMPALYWDVFIALAEWIDLHVFVLAPSREYWGDVERTRERLRMEVEHPGAAALFESGHPLLASLGRARRHAAVRLADTVSGLASAEYELFVDPPATLLGTLQRDILDLAASRDVPRDASLQVHACHGPQREAEVLHDRLLALFESLPGLTPADILILTPDIEIYAPLVEAVLTQAPPGRRIPCAVADRALAQLPAWRALRRLCAVAAGDLDAESALALLEEPAVRRACAIAEDELALLRDWTATAGIRWGVDARDRRQRGLPAEAAHTWRAGLRRLLLGVALPDTAERLHDDVLPVAGIEGGRAALLGRFIDFAEALFDLAQKVSAGRTATEWEVVLAAAFERFVAPDEDEEEGAQRVRAALAALAGEARAAACEVRLPLAVLLRELDAELAERAPARAFATGSATIAALQPGRPLPARVICLVGMNEGAWPRPAPRPGFDLLARFPRSGDRDRRGEERHAFLESLLCATDALVVTHTGRDPRGNTEYPPAAPLAELLDTLAAMTGRPADELVVQHPLQPFSPAYFAGDAALFSYDAEHCRASAAAQAPRAAQPFCAGAEAAAPAEEIAAVELDRLRRFLVHPVRFHLRERLGIHLEESEELLEIHEPFVADPLTGHHLRAAFFEGLRAGQAAPETVRLLRARGLLPHGVAGELACAAARDEAVPLWEAARPWAAETPLPPCAAEFGDGVMTLAGTLDGLTARGLWRVRHGRTRAADRLRLWLDHLLLQIAAPAGVVRESALIARDGVTRFAPIAPVAAAAAHLADLLELYRAGLRAPLPFYPETAWAWIEGKGVPAAWVGDAYRGRPGERDDAYVRLALRDAAGDPLGAEFRQLAERIYTPLHAALAA